MSIADLIILDIVSSFFVEVADMISMALSPFSWFVIFSTTESLRSLSVSVSSIFSSTFAAVELSVLTITSATIFE